MAVMNEFIGATEYDNLVNSAYPADIIHASLASGYGELKRGYLIARNSTGSLIPWGSDITDNLVAELTVSSHQATKSQSGLRADLLRVFSLDFVEGDLAVDSATHAATLALAGLDEETLVVKSGGNTLTAATDYTASYDNGVLTIELVSTSNYYGAETLSIKCYLEDEYVELAEGEDYTATYTNNTLTVALDDESKYYETPKVKVVCPYAYSEGAIAGAVYVLAEDVDTGASSGRTITARVYRTGVFNRNRLLYNPKAVDGIGDVTKEKMRSLGILLNDAFN